MGVAVPLMAIAGIGAGISAYGKYEAGQAQAATASYQAQVAANNAAIAKENATLEMNAGEVAATNQGMKTRAMVGAEKAGQGAGGIDVNTGSTVAVRSGTEELGLLDAMTIRSNAARKAYGYQVAATSDTAQSQLDTMEASQAKQAGDIGALGTLLSSASSVGGKFAGLKMSTGGGAPAEDPFTTGAP